MRLKSIMTNDEVEALARVELEAFANWMYYAQHGRPLKPAPHHKAVFDALTRVILGKTKRLIINIPPRSGKTLMVSQLLPAFWLGLKPHANFILTSYSKTLATANTYAIREIVRHEAYQWLWRDNPPILKDDSQAKDEFNTEQGGMVYAVGSGGTITGRGAGAMDDATAGALIIDDIAKPTEAQSDTMRQNVIDWYHGTLESRKNNPDTPIIIIGQRLHENDLPGYLLNGGSGEEWELLKIPAITDEGVSFWEEQFPMSMLEKIEKSAPYVLAGQYMQEPTPRGGGDFKPANIQIVDTVPAGLKFVRGWDLAGTTNKTSDYTASVKMAIDSSGIIWIADVFRLKGSPDEVEAKLRQTAAVDGRGALQSIPKDPGQAGVSQTSNLSKQLHGFNFTFTPESGDKRSRAMAIAAQINVGNVRLVKNEFTEAYLHELESFPNGTNDDMVDATSRAYNALISGNKSQQPIQGNYR